jgi:Mn2+/Fe2+ NRAMP family transporter
LANDRRLLGTRVNSGLVNVLGWTTTATLVCLTLLLAASALL